MQNGLVFNNSCNIIIRPIIRSGCDIYNYLRKIRIVFSGLNFSPKNKSSLINCLSKQQTRFPNNPTKCATWHRCNLFNYPHNFERWRYLIDSRNNLMRGLQWSILFSAKYCVTFTTCRLFYSKLTIWAWQRLFFFSV